MIKTDRKEYLRLWRINNPNYHKLWCQENKDYLKKYEKLRQPKRKEYFKLWQQKNKEHLKEWYIKNRDRINERRKKLKHQRGINRKYIFEMGISYTEEYQKQYKKQYRIKNKERIKFDTKKYKYNKRQAGILSTYIIQLVYEDNIKKYGTLTCYLCLQPIPFGKDHLEHKIPLSRGGTNLYENLAIACQSCNCGKRNKTTEEFIFKKQGLKPKTKEELIGNSREYGQEFKPR